MQLFDKRVIPSFQPRNGRILCSLVGTLLFLWVLPFLEAQNSDERPEVHADFEFGVFPWSMEAVEIFSSEDSRLLISGLHNGWSVDKYIDRMEKSRVEVLTLLDELEEGRWVRGPGDFAMRPGFPVFREDDLAIMEPRVAQDAEGLAGIIESHWNEVEEFVASLEVGQSDPRPQTFYRVIVGGVLLGGMIDALHDDGTLLPGPPRRARRGESYYGWMVEGGGGPKHIVKQSARVGRHQIFSLGPVAETEFRIQIDEVAEQGPVYESEDARRWRIFGGVLSRDYLLPYFKSLRSDLLELHSDIDASKYSAFGEFVAWYYQSVVGRVADILSRNGRIEAPGTAYKYAIRVPR